MTYLQVYRAHLAATRRAGEGGQWTMFKAIRDAILQSDAALERLIGAVDDRPTGMDGMARLYVRRLDAMIDGRSDDVGVQLCEIRHFLRQVAGMEDPR